MVYKRVVITGMGVISPIASGTDEFWKLLLAGTSGVRPVQSFDSTDYAAHIGGEVLGFDPTLHVKKLRPDSIGRASQLAIGASRMALSAPNLPPPRASLLALRVLDLPQCGERPEQLLAGAVLHDKAGV